MHRRRVHLLGTALALGTLAFVMLLPVLARTPEVDTQARSTTAAPLDLTELDRVSSLPLLPPKGLDGGPEPASSSLLRRCVWSPAT